MSRDFADSPLGWVVGVGAAHAILAVLFLLNLTSFSVAHTAEIKPFFVLMAVYYWSVCRPTLLPPAAVFAIGVVMDVLSGLPAGLTAAILVAAQWLVCGQRRYLLGQSYAVLWTGFAITCAAAAFAQWGLFGLTRLAWPSPVPVAVSCGVGMLLFAPVSFFLHQVHRILPVESRI